MRATQGMDKSVPRKSVNTLSMTGSSVALLQPYVEKNRIILELFFNL